MPEVRVTGLTKHFRANHAVSAVSVFDNSSGINGFKVTWPSTTGVKLCVRRKESRAATDTVIDTGGPVIPELAREGAFSAFLAGNVVCFGRQ